MVQQGEDANRSRRPEEEVTVTQRMEEAQANAQAPWSPGWLEVPLAERETWKGEGSRKRSRLG